MLLKELRLQAKNITALYHFYNDVIELPVTTQRDHISIAAGDSTIVFAETNATDPFYHFAFNIPSNKFEEAFEWTQKKAGLIVAS